MTLKDIKIYSDNLSSSVKDDIYSFDKNFFLVAFGVFAFTVTFIKDIVPYQKSGSPWILAISWTLMAIAMGLTIAAYFVSAVHKEYLGYRLLQKIEHIKDRHNSISVNNQQNTIPINSQYTSHINPDEVEEVENIIIEESFRKSLIQYLLRLCSVITFILDLLFLCGYILLNFIIKIYRRNRLPAHTLARQTL